MTSNRSRSARSITGAVVLPIALLAGVASAGAAAGEKATRWQQRGYETCLKQFHRDTRTLRTERRYFIDERSSDINTFYLNGKELTRQGRLQPVRMTCETPKRGRPILSAIVEPGEFAPRTRVTVDVASN